MTFIGHRSLKFFNSIVQYFIFLLTLYKMKILQSIINYSKVIPLNMAYINA